MSTRTVDERVVEMQFDNSNFEQNVKESMGTLDQFNSKLNSSFNTKGIGESLSSVSKSINSISFEGLSSGLEVVQTKFSALQIMGIAALSRITNEAITAGKKIANAIATPIIEGGKNRALNIEQAKFQLSGLGVGWDEIKDDIDYGVKGTAYGLDAAAKVASQLIASEVKMGDEMKAALRGISGTAAMTNSSFEEIGDIFTTVAGNGRLMTMQLQQLSFRGLNAASTLGKALGKSEAEIREMVSKGQIDFATFAKAMDDSFGEHAKEANKTFTGAMSNVKSALGRIGADVQATKMESLRQVFVELIPVVDGFHTALKPALEGISSGMEWASIIGVKALRALQDELESGDIEKSVKKHWSRIANPIAKAARNITSSFKEFKKLDGLTKTFEIFTNALEAVKQILRPIKRGFEEMLPKGVVGTLAGISSKMADFTKKLWLTSDAQMGIQKATVMLLSALKQIGSFVKPVTDIIGAVIVKIHELTDELLSFVAFPESHGLEKFSSGFGIVGKAVDLFREKLVQLKDIIKSMSFEKVGDFLAKVGNKAHSVFDKLKTYFSGFKDTLKNLGKYLRELLGGLGEAFDGIFSNINFGDVTNLIKSGLLWSFILQIKQLTGTVTGLTTNASAIAKVAKNINFALESFSKTTNLTAVAKSVLMLAGAMFLLSAIDTEKLGQSMVAVISVMYSLIGAVKLMTLITGALFKVVAAITALSVSVLILSVAISILASIKLDDLVKGVTAVSVILLALVGTVALLSKIQGSIPKVAAAMMGMSVAVAMLALSIKVLSTIPFEKLLKGIIGLAATLAILVVAMNSLSAISVKCIIAATGMMILAGALLLITASIAILGALPVDVVTRGILFLALALGGLVVALNLMPDNMIAIGAGLSLMGVGLVLLAGALTILSLVPWDRLLVSFGVLTLSLIAFGGIASMLGELAGPIALCGAALIVLGLGLTAISVPLILLSAIPFKKLMSSFGALTLSLIAFGAISAVLGVVAPLILACGASLIVLGLGLTAITIPLILLIKINPANLAKSVLVMAAALIVLGGVSYLLLGAVPAIAALGASLLVLGPGMLMVTGSIYILAKAMKDLIEVFRILGPAIKEAGKALWTVVKDIGSIIIDGLKGIFGIHSPSTVMMDIGKFLIEGLIIGIKNMLSSAKDSIKDFGKGVLETFKDILGIHSPSKEAEAIGDYFGLGLIAGLRGVSDQVDKSAEQMGNGALSSLKNAVSNIDTETDISSQVTITPVLDLSNVEQDAGKIGDLLNTNKTIELANTAKISSAAVESVNTSQNNNASIVDAMTSMKDEMASMLERLGNLQVVMDNGALVGQLSAPMDRALGNRATQARRSAGNVSRQVSYS